MTDEMITSKKYKNLDNITQEVVLELIEEKTKKFIKQLRKDNIPKEKIKLIVSTFKTGLIAGIDICVEIL